MAKPASHPDWTNDGSSTKVIEPSAGFKLTGWQADVPPPFQYMNWLFYNISLWINYFETTTDQKLLTVQTISVSGATSIATTTQVGIGDCTTGSQTWNLPPAAGNAGARLVAKKIDSTANTITLDANASELIDGQLTQVIDQQYSSLEIVCDGTRWNII